MRIERPARDPDVTVFVAGVASTAGSKTSGVVMKGPKGAKVPVMGPNGRPRTYTKDSSGEKGKSWKGMCAGAAADVMDALGLERLDGALYVEMTFRRERSAGHFGAGRNAGTLKDSAPLYPSVRPDVLKHARAVEDALTGVVWVDDSRIVCGPNEKVFASRREPVGVEVRVWRLPSTVGEYRMMCATEAFAAAELLGEEQPQAVLALA